MKNLKKLKLFAQFAQTYTTHFENNCRFIIYAIGSPFKSSISSVFANQLQIPIYILVQELQKNILLKSEHRLVRYDAPFEHIIHITVGDEILASGQVIPFLMPYNQSEKIGIIESHLQIQPSSQANIF